MQTFDTIVVGLGAMGAAALWQLARRGQRVIGLDRWDPPHSFGSTHGETRITRCAIGEGEVYVPFALRSHEIWRELEAETGESLLTQCGLLMLSGGAGGAVIHGKPDFLGRTIAAAETFAIPYEVLSPDEVMRRYPQFRLRGHEHVYFEPGAGYVRPEHCVRAQLVAAKRAGATICSHVQVVSLARDGSGVCVTTADGDEFYAGRAILAAGMWAPSLAGPTLARHMSVTRQALHWFAPDDPAAFTPDRFPAFLWSHGDTSEDSFYGFPIPPGTHGVKLAREQDIVRTADPDQIVRTVEPGEAQALIRDHVDGRILGIDPTPLRSAVCAYTNTPDREFLFTALPDNDRVWLLSACSGHGFKHSAALGEAVAAAVIADEPSSLASFAPDRLHIV